MDGSIVFHGTPIPHWFIHCTVDGHIDELKFGTLMKEPTTRCVSVGYLTRGKLPSLYIVGFSRDCWFSKVVLEIDTSSGVRVLAAPGLNTWHFLSYIFSGSEVI